MLQRIERTHQIERAIAKWKRESAGPDVIHQFGSGMNIDNRHLRIWNCGRGQNENPGQRAGVWPPTSSTLYLDPTGRKSFAMGCSKRYRS
jgi:hypothetical protein